MTTQIAPTPIVRGSEAYKILSEIYKKSSHKSKKGAEKLADFF